MRESTSGSRKLLDFRKDSLFLTGKKLDFRRVQRPKDIFMDFRKSFLALKWVKLSLDCSKR